MKEYMINDYTGKLGENYKDSMFDIKIVEGKSPIAAVREAFQGYGKIRKAKREENPDVILTEIKRVGNYFTRTSGQMCYMFEEA